MSILSLLKLNPLFLFTLILGVLCFIDILTFICIKNQYKSSRKFYNLLFIVLYASLSLVIYFFLVKAFFIHRWIRSNEDFIHLYYLSDAITIIYFPKFVYLLTFSVEKLIRLSGLLFLNKNFGSSGLSKKNSSLALIVACFICILFVYGLFSGRFHYQVVQHNIEFSDLPVSFNNLKIVQISDIHVSTYYKNENHFNKIVELVNVQKPDLIFFTGDLINNFAEEVKPFIPYLLKMKARYGKYAVLGNHDYGDYYIWKTDNEGIENHKLLIKYINSTGFRLLLNENIVLKRDKDSIVIAGTENWGRLPYRQTGDLRKTLKGTNLKNFILLLSHDPYFWDKFVRSHSNIKVTFSGHTHGMQIGISCGNFNWAPFHMRYKRWIGMYKENNQFLYVNRGLGSGLYAGRVGMWPEISVFILKNK